MTRLLLIAAIATLMAGCQLMPWRQTETLDFIVGHTTDTTTTLTVHTHRPKRVTVHLREEGSLFSQSESVVTDAEWGNRGHITFRGLKPSTTYFIEADHHTGQVRTMPRPWLDVPVRIGFGSCINFRNSTVTIHPEGEPMEWPAHMIWERLVDEDLDAWAFIGDRFYMPNWYDDYDDMTEDEVREVFLEHHRGMMGVPGVEERLATVPTYVINDDHDAGPNNAAGDFEFIDLANDVIRHTHAVPPSEHSMGRGCYYRVRIGQVECFFLDGRTFRESANRMDGEHLNTTPISERGPGGVWYAPEMLDEMHGPEQMAWLREGLQESDARVKLIISGNQMLSNIHPWEAWYMYRERDEFLEWLAQERIPGVIFVAGDRHQGYIGVLPSEDNYPLWELTASGLGVNVYYDDEDTPQSPYELRGPGARRPHYGVVEYDPAEGGQVTLRIEGEDRNLKAVRIPLSQIQ